MMYLASGLLIPAVVGTVQLYVPVVLTLMTKVRVLLGRLLKVILDIALNCAPVKFHTFCPLANVKLAFPLLNTGERLFVSVAMEAAELLKDEKAELKSINPVPTTELVV